MSRLRVALDEYLKVRRALGCKLLATGNLLQRFVDLADRQGADFITTELALKWAVQPSQAHLLRGNQGENSYCRIRECSPAG